MGRQPSVLVFLSLLCLTVLPLSAASQTTLPAWSHGFGGSLEDQGTSVAVDDGGYVVMTGYASGPVDFGGGVLPAAGSYDIILVKFDSAGNHVWSKRFGDANAQWGRDVAVDDAGNILLTGEFLGTVDFGGGVLTDAGSRDIYVAKFDALGTHLWSQRFGDTNQQYGQSVAADAAGNVLITGRFRSSVDFGGGVLTSAGGTDIYVAKFDPSGAHLWSQRFGHFADDEESVGIAADGAGNFVITGRFNLLVDFGGGTLTSLYPADIFVAKFDPSGTHVWSQAFGEDNDQLAHDIAVDDDGNILVTGEFNGPVDFGGGVLTASSNYMDVFVAKLNPAGGHVWSGGFGDANDQRAYAIAVDAAGNTLVTGFFEGLVDFGGGILASTDFLDLFVARFNAAGDHLSSQAYGGLGTATGYGIAADGSGNTLVTGDFFGYLSFGVDTLTSVDMTDLFIAKLLRTEPQIRSVRDVPGDQGGLVNVAWDGSGTDTPSEHLITRYSVWRAISAAQAAAMMDAGATLAATSKVRTQEWNGSTYYWYEVASVDAQYLSGYSAPVPTLFDSTSASSEMHYFQVIAHTADPYVFYTSPPDSGYSVDDLAPATPQNLVGAQTAATEMQLSWDANSEADLSHYAVYRGTAPDFTPGAGNRVGTSPDTALTDTDWDWSAGYTYKVSAVDVHGNESGHAVLAPDNVTGTDDTAPPLRTYLAQNHPNPFNPTTRIVFGLKEAGAVSLRVYDASGRLVRVLAEGRREARRHEVEWDGRDDAGRAVASGVYFYRLVAGGETFTRKAVLLK